MFDQILPHFQEDMFYVSWLTEESIRAVGQRAFFSWCVAAAFVARIAARSVVQVASHAHVACSTHVIITLHDLVPWVEQVSQS